ncbi:hypothetical protein [Streptomyces smyrnaeus]|uniref:hypothetical protein n=1 Tax=Streptomyces smyrnaeus TaxID=1387713 RepID=UPI0033E64747
MSALRPLIMFFGVILMLAIVVLTPTCGLLFVSHGGLSLDLFEALALLVLCFALLMGCSRLLAGHWHRWSRRSANRVEAHHCTAGAHHKRTR